MRKIDWAKGQWEVRKMRRLMESDASSEQPVASSQQPVASSFNLGCTIKNSY